MLKSAISRLLVAGLVVAGSCKGSEDPPEIGPPAQIVPVEGNNQSALANTELPQPIRVQVQDANGRAVGAGFTVTFAIVEGGGSIVGSATATADANGVATAPGWKLGKSALPQKMRATVDNISGDVSATVTTQYDIVVRYFGDPMSDANKLLFERAAARIEALITSEVANALANNVDLAADCDVTGQPPLNEEIDDILIYAAITTIDGPGQVLAQASPCLARKSGNPSVDMVAIGLMKFDAADFSGLANQQNIQDVIVHEMLHVIGSGTLWINRGFLSGQGGFDPRYLGPRARQACVALGGTVPCASSVPLENQGGTGTRDFHWRESTFGSELMTGFYNQGVNPLSNMTVESMADLGFVVNNAAVDPYTVTGMTQMSTLPAGWERITPLRGMLLPNGRVERITLK